MNFLKGQYIYLAYVLGLVFPGAEVPAYDTYRNTPGSLVAWTDTELQLLVDEGRRQLDRQGRDFDRIVTRSQWLFTAGLALGGALAALGAIVLADHSYWSLGVWVLSLVATAYAGLGSAAVLSVRADFENIDSAILSTYPSPVLHRLAADYSSMAKIGETTIATRLTVFRQAIIWMIIGGVAGLASWLVAR
jgi:hypothetical protein